MKNAALLRDDETHAENLWERFTKGEEDALDELARIRYRMLYNYATRFTRDTEQIKDCIQDLFLELWYRRDNLSQTPYVTIYLIKSLRNNLLRKIKLDHRLDKSGDISEAVEYLTDNLTIETVLISSESMTEKEREIRNAINRLPKRQQEVIFLKFYQGLSNDEIAAVMGVERQSVSNFLHRAISTLKQDLPLFSRITFLLVFYFLE